jgi:hypothetical protein
MGYDIHFVDHADRIFGSDSFEAANDAKAIELGRSLYRSNIGRGHEIWQGDRHVHSEVYGANSGGAHNGRLIRCPNATQSNGISSNGVAKNRRKAAGKI